MPGIDGKSTHGLDRVETEKDVPFAQCLPDGLNVDAVTGDKMTGGLFGLRTML